MKPDLPLIPIVYAFFSLIVLLFYATYGTLNSNPDISVFRASPSQPWGAITCMFFSFSTEGMVHNLASILVVSAFLFIFMTFMGLRNVKMLAIIPFLIQMGILAIRDTFIQTTEYLIGDSLISYSLAGMLAGISVIFIVLTLFRGGAVKQKGRFGHENALLFALSVLFVAIAITGISSFPSIFFAIAPSVWYLGHIAAFFIGLFVMPAVSYRSTRMQHSI